MSKSPLCEAMDIPCQETRGSVTCEMCFRRYMVRELRKVKDELKLIKVRLPPQDCEELNYGKMFSRSKKPRNIPGVGGPLDEPTIR